MTYDEIKQVIDEKIPVGLIKAEHTEDCHYYRHTGVDELYPSVTTKAGVLDKKYLKVWAVNKAIEHVEKHWEIAQEDRDLILWEAKQQHALILQDASEIGTAGHEAVETYMLDWIKMRRQPDDMEPYILGIRSFPQYVKDKDSRLWCIARSALTFFQDYHIEPIASEIQVASTEHKLAGTLDAVALMGEVVEPGDKECTHTYKETSQKNIKKCTQCGQTVQMKLTLLDWKTSNSADKDEYAMQVAAYWKAFEEMTGLTPDAAYIIRLDKFKVKYDMYRVSDPESAFEAYTKASWIYDWLDDGPHLQDLQAKKVISLL